jgi:hypothetical protein
LSALNQLLSDWLLSLGKRGPEHRQTTSRLRFGRFILQNIPVFREHRQRFRADRAAMTRGTLVPGRRQRLDKKNPRYFFFASATEAHESLGCSSFNVPFSGALYWTHVIPSSGACHPAWPFEAKLQGKHRAS